MTEAFKTAFTYAYDSASDEKHFSMSDLGKRFEPEISATEVREKLIRAGYVVEMKDEEGNVFAYAPAPEATYDNVCWMRQVERTNKYNKIFRYFEMCWLEEVLIRLDGFAQCAQRRLPYAEA